MSMVVLVPSRNRPASIARLMQAWVDTGAAADLVVMVDDDDPTLPGYEALDWSTHRLIVGPRLRLGPWLNEWAPTFAEEYMVVGNIGDDHVPRTPRWDARILEVSTPWTVVYGDDLLQGQNLPTAVFQGSGLIKATGQYNPPALEHMYIDNYWKELGERLGTLVWLPDVIIEHVHFANGKSPKDALYAEVNDVSVYTRDRAAFDDWLAVAADDDIARVRAAMARELS